MKKPNKAQRVSFFFAIVFYISALASLSATAYFGNSVGGQHPWTASCAAAIVFFLSAGFVLHVMARADIPDLKIRR